MGGLPDINTERPSFQKYFFNYINDCIACGADGFRYDTAKHIGLSDDPKEDDGFKNNFWEKATKEVDNAENLFIYGEVLQGDNDRLADYIKKSAEPHQAPTAVKFVRELQAVISTRQLCLIIGLAMQTRIS